MKFSRARTRFAVLLMAATGGLVLAGSAFAHAQVSPPVVVAKKGQVFTLAVPTEGVNAVTTKIELTPPAGFARLVCTRAGLEARGAVDGKRRGDHDSEGDVVGWQRAS